MKNIFIIFILNVISGIICVNLYINKHITFYSFIILMLIFIIAEIAFVYSFDNKPSEVINDDAIKYQNYILTIERNGVKHNLVVQYTNLVSLLLIEKEFGNKTVILFAKEITLQEYNYYENKIK